MLDTPHLMKHYENIDFTKISLILLDYLKNIHITLKNGCSGKIGTQAMN